MNTRIMKSRSEPVDRLSNLPDVLLITIISLLPFRECVSTSALSSRWRTLCHETTNISFKESEYMNRGQFVSNTDARDSFVSYMVKWVSRFQCSVIDTFEMHLSNPVGYVGDIKNLIEFAASRKVRKLVLDFSDPAWRTTRDAIWLYAVIHLPACVYALTTLEYLKLYAVEFDPSSFVSQERLKTLSIGWTTLKEGKSLLSKCHMLETLSMRYGWEVDIKKIEGRIRELVIENCNFYHKNMCSFYLPSIEIFKYAGEFLGHVFKKGNTVMKEVSLDFGVMPEYDKPTGASRFRGSHITRFLRSVRSAKTFTACPYLLQAIQECNNPGQLLDGMEAQHLVLRTRLRPKEFEGIGLLLDNCKNLEKLTIDIVPSPPSLFPMARSYYCNDPKIFWQKSYTFPCLRTSLKVVVVRNFDGGVFQLDMLKYLARTAKGLVRVLQRVEIYLRKGMDPNRMAVATAQAEMLKAFSKRAKVIVHNA
ncbi:unnamed protein product [Microthlaspi erraticum]|uniref:F-box domain-containing protein n=1 Tax=Microthlaspi erraticum TaxID=1685480 RepID=A0A6D2IG08_9BRAS|nr:unnamed protein product [Microthlaspi erraticum]CAA7025902.1 unnamed protein product [Microthlaspi erraticum]